MPDRMVTTMSIGGIVTEAQALKLCQLISAENVEAGGYEFRPQTVQDLLDHTANVADGTIYFMNSEQACGKFDEIEAFCIKNDISFDRTTDPYCEYDGELVRFRSEMGEPIFDIADSSGEKIIRVSELKDVQNALECGDTQEAKTLLDSLIGEDIPPLEMFDIAV